MHLLRNSLVLSLFLCSFYAHAQQKMVLLNGSEIPLKSYTENNEDIIYKKIDAKNDRTKSIEKIDVFSIVKEDGTEELFYKSDTLTFTVEEVRNYIRGEQTAKQYYNKPANKWIAGAFGLGSCVLSFYSLPVPMLYSVVVGRFNPRKMQIPADVKVEGSTTEAFRFGYNKQARNMKIQQSLKWGYISLGIGLTGVIIYGIANH